MKSKKEQLIDAYPQYEEIIEEMWHDQERWINRYTDDTGQVCYRYDPDTKITEAFKYTVVEMELEPYIEEEINRTIDARQKYRLKRGYPSRDAEEQFYIALPDRRAWIDLPLHPSEMHEAKVVEVNGKVYVNGYFVLDIGVEK